MFRAVPNRPRSGPGVVIRRPRRSASRSWPPKESGSPPATWTASIVLARLPGSGPPAVEDVAVDLALELGQRVGRGIRSGRRSRRRRRSRRPGCPARRPPSTCAAIQPAAAAPGSVVVGGSAARAVPPAERARVSASATAPALRRSIRERAIVAHLSNRFVAPDWVPARRWIRQTRPSVGHGWARS